MSPSYSSLLLLGMVAGLWVTSGAALNVSVSTPSNCTLLCGRDYNPVCGGSPEEKRSFLNECELHAYNCRTKKELAVLDKNKVCPGDERLFE